MLGQQAWQEWQGSAFVRVRSRSRHGEKGPQITFLSERQRTPANARRPLPCRRSWVRVPSSALKTSVNRGFCLGMRQRGSQMCPNNLSPNCVSRSPSHHAAYREPCDRQSRGCDAAVEVFLLEKAPRLPKTQRLATTTLEVCIPGDRTRPTRRPGSPLNLAQKSFRAWLPRSHGTVGGTNSCFHRMLGPEEWRKICCRGDEGRLSGGWPLRRLLVRSGEPRS
jgi:hypothetical protein